MRKIQHSVTSSIMTVACNTMIATVPAGASTGLYGPSCRAPLHMRPVASWVLDPE